MKNKCIILFPMEYQICRKKYNKLKNIQKQKIQRIQRMEGNKKIK